MATTRGRLVQQNQVVYDQVDFYQSNGFTRITGLTPGALTLQVFWENVIQPWPLTNGLPTTDAQVASGNVYFNEIPGAPGFYNIRWRPSALGFWRILITYTLGLQVEAQDYDVVQSVPSVESGLSASFIKPEC